MLQRLPAQIVLFFAAALVAAVISNAARTPPLPWRGVADPELLRHPQVQAISVDEAARVHDAASTLFLDVRPRRGFDAGRVRGAVSFPADGLEVAYEELRDFLGPEVQIVVYAQETLSAVRAAEFLAARGRPARVLRGGWQAWRDRGLAVETTEARTQPVAPEGVAP